MKRQRLEKLLRCTRGLKKRTFVIKYDGFPVSIYIHAKKSTMKKLARYERGLNRLIRYEEVKQILQSEGPIRFR